ncbi:hypothetical protein MTR67_029172 [Solanum verrucosum]|uniref:HMA domain-containing protein n=1 Tax=Solanum verrucosum TaxID=315347 RepID=A0AAF0R3R5_SOLVR|nr:hypothetical protein MTR67_029172 [Solanum verrucosum]
MQNKSSSKNIEGETKSEEQHQEKKEGGKNEQNNRNVVLKVEFHCEGCVRKILKVVRSFEDYCECCSVFIQSVRFLVSDFPNFWSVTAEKGVEKVISDSETNKVTAIGEVDALKLKVKVERKMNKAVQLISPLPKDCKKEKKQNENEPKSTKGDDKKTKEKEPPVTTVILKLHLHCEGCIQKIQKAITKNKGYKEMKIDQEKELVTVIGSMDMKELVEVLKKQLKKDVQIVPPKKEGGEKKEGGGGGGGKGNEKGKDGQGGGEKKEQYEYPELDATAFHATQLFSDENANACSIM